MTAIPRRQPLEPKLNRNLERTYAFPPILKAERILK
jgi:hypothetical protein